LKSAAIYARISQKDDLVDKVENQILEMTKFAESFGYQVVEIFSDDDISAYKGEKDRPQFGELVSRLSLGEFQAVLATEQSRFARDSPKDLQALVSAAARVNAVIHTRAEGLFDPSNPGSKFMMQLLDAFGGYEVALRIERQKARNRADLAEGLPTKGLRPFGWKKDRISILESEAVHIRAAIQAIVNDGATVWGIAQKWNALGLVTDSMLRPRKHRIEKTLGMPSAVWTTTSVRDMLSRPRNAGILMSGDAEMPKSQIQPIVSRELFEEFLLAIRGAKTNLGARPQYLLGGIMECTCGARMNASKSNSGRPGQKHDYKIYRCRLYGFDKSQSHVTVQLHLADTAVRDWLVENIGLGIESTEAMATSELKVLNAEYLTLLEKDASIQDLIIEGLGIVPELKGKLRVNLERRDQIDARREQIFASQGHSREIRDFAKTMMKLRDSAPDKSINKVLEKGYAAWDELPMDVRRSIVRSGYRVQLQAGGRGIDRVLISPKSLELLREA
jgi:site-specific DNA recombinase